MQRLPLSSGTEQQQKAEASGQRRHERAERWRTLCDNLNTRHERAERTEQHVCVRTWAERREDAATTSALANGPILGAGGRRLHRRGHRAVWPCTADGGCGRVTSHRGGISMGRRGRGRRRAEALLLLLADVSGDRSCRRGARACGAAVQSRRRSGLAPGWQRCCSFARTTGRSSGRGGGSHGGLGCFVDLGLQTFAKAQSGLDQDVH